MAVVCSSQLSGHLVVTWQKWRPRESGRVKLFSSGLRLLLQYTLMKIGSAPSLATEILPWSLEAVVLRSSLWGSCERKPSALPGAVLWCH